MKPRLKSVRLTDEDWDVWAEVWTRGPDIFPSDHLRAGSLAADRRDADLMLSLRQARQHFTEAGYDHGLLASNTVIRDMTGRTEPGEEYYGGVPLPRLNISSCAIEGDMAMDIKQALREVVQNLCDGGVGMKPPTPLPFLTQEDRNVWVWVLERWYRYMWGKPQNIALSVHSQNADRRDAELMYRHAQGRAMFGSRAVDVLQAWFPCSRCTALHQGWETESDIGCAP